MDGCTGSTVALRWCTRILVWRARLEYQRTDSESDRASGLRVSEPEPEGREPSRPYLNTPLSSPLPPDRPKSKTTQRTLTLPRAVCSELHTLCKLTARVPLFDFGAVACAHRRG
eukprot:2131837-Rhodomonas_salina.2